MSVPLPNKINEPYLKTFVCGDLSRFIVIITDSMMYGSVLYWTLYNEWETDILHYVNIVRSTTFRLRATVLDSAVIF